MTNSEVLAARIVHTWCNWDDLAPHIFEDLMEVHAFECAMILAADESVPAGLRAGFAALRDLYQLAEVPASSDFTFDEIVTGLERGEAPRFF